MSRVLSMRFQEDQMERLRRQARRLGRSPSETAALLVEESLRRSEFGFVDFRDSPVGRQAYLQGSSLAVWEIVLVARSLRMDAASTAKHLDLPVMRVRAALAYAEAYSEELEAAIQDNDALDFTAISRMLPQAEQFVVRDTEAGIEEEG